MKEIVEKKEVEELLGCEITDEQFEEALKYARHEIDSSIVIEAAEYFESAKAFLKTIK